MLCNLVSHSAHLTGPGRPGKRPGPSTGSRYSTSARQREARSLLAPGVGAGLEGGAPSAAAEAYVFVVAHLRRNPRQEESLPVWWIPVRYKRVALSM